MCGRFAFDLSPEIIAGTFSLSPPPDITPRFNVAPTQAIHAVRSNADGQRRLDTLHWGLVPSWAKDRSIAAKMINARSETAAEKPAFRQALRHRRCLIPASGFYEWKKEGKAKVPFYFSMKDGGPMVFAGLWETWKEEGGDELVSCTILTTSANPLVESVHDRMPVVLHPGEFDLWLDRTATDTATLSRLFQPYPADLMVAREVSPLVNSARNEGRELLETTGEAQGALW